MSWSQACKHRHPDAIKIKQDPLAGMCLRVVHKSELCDKHYAEKVEQEIESLRQQLTTTQEEFKEAREVVSDLAKEVHPYTIHEHRDDLEGRFGKLIEQAKRVLAKYPRETTKGVSK